MVEGFYAKLGRFDFSGVATGGGHAVSIVEVQGVAVPQRRPVVVLIDAVKVAELQEWSQKLRAKFAEATHG